MAARLHSWLAVQVRRVPAGLATGSVQSVLSTLAWLVQATITLTYWSTSPAERQDWQSGAL